MRVLITGGAGFIGSHIVSYLSENTDWELVSLDRLTYASSQSRLLGLNVKLVYHDLRAEINDTVRRELGEFDYIFHLAASSHVTNSIADPLQAVYNNVVATCNVLNFAISQSDLKRFFFFSTDEVFGSAHGGEVFDEYSRYNSLNPYSATKAGSEELCISFANTYELPVTTIHPSNVFGFRQNKEKFIPLCIERIQRGERILIHARSGAPAERQYINAFDVARACQTLITEQADELKINISGETHKSSLEVAQFISDVMGKPLHYEMTETDPSRPNFDQKYHTSCNILKSYGWAELPKFSFEKTMPLIIADYISANF